MFKRFTTTLGLFLLACQGVALANSPASIMQRTLEVRSERLQGVKTVAVRKTVLGIRQVEYFAAHTFDTGTGVKLNALRTLSPGEVSEQVAQNWPMSTLHN